MQIDLESAITKYMLENAVEDVIAIDQPVVILNRLYPLRSIDRSVAMAKLIVDKMLESKWVVMCLDEHEKSNDKHRSIVELSDDDVAGVFVDDHNWNPLTADRTTEVVLRATATGKEYYYTNMEPLADVFNRVLRAPGGSDIPE